MKTFFGFPEGGSLTLEHTFYMLGCDHILFVCENANGLRFLCSCYHLGEGWVIGRVEEKILVDLIDDRITIREVFEQHCSPKWHVIWDGETYGFEKDVPEDILPEKGALLELKSESQQYRKVLLQALQPAS